MKTNKQKTKVKCPKCKYEWETKSVMKYVTCANCQHKFNRLINSLDEI